MNSGSRQKIYESIAHFKSESTKEFIEIFREFSDFTTLHGIKNILGDFDYLDQLNTSGLSSK